MVAVAEHRDGGNPTKQQIKQDLELAFRDGLSRGLFVPKISATQLQKKLQRVRLQTPRDNARLHDAIDRIESYLTGRKGKKSLTANWALSRLYGSGQAGATRPVLFHLGGISVGSKASAGCPRGQPATIRRPGVLVGRLSIQTKGMR